MSSKQQQQQQQQQSSPFQRGWVGFGRNYFHNLGSDPWSRVPTTADGVGLEELYSWGLEDDDQKQQYNNTTATTGTAYQYCKEIPNKPNKKKKDDDNNNNNGHNQMAPAACSSAATYFLSGTKHNRIMTIGTVHGHVMNPILEEAQGGPVTDRASFSPFVNVSPCTITIPLPLPCVELAAGRHFCLARLEGGLAVCSWGAGHFGQLGHGTTSFSSSQQHHADATNSNPASTSTYQASPKVIERLLPRMVGSPIVQIAAGDWHGMALSQEGTVYAWGCNRNMQCGRKSTRGGGGGGSNKSGGGGSSSAPLQMVPMPVTILDADPDSRGDEPPVAIAKIAAGKAHSVAVTKRTNQVYCWGASHYGQCASNSGSSTVRTSKYTRNTTALPRLVHSLQDIPIIDIAAGDRHTLALSQNGRVFSWGAGAEGQLGIFPPIVCTPKPRVIHDLDFVAIHKSGSDNNNNNPATIPTITSLHASGCSSFALSSSGHVYVWGSNDARNLGVPIPSSDRLPYWEVGVTPLPAGDERYLQVRTFDSEHNVLLPRRLDVLGGINVEDITAGPSHSWFFGETRSSQQSQASNSNNGEAVVIGRTLYEVQQRNKGGAGGGGGGGGNGSNNLQTMGSFNVTSSSLAGSTSAGTTSEWGENSLSNIDGARPFMSPSSTMPTDEEDDTTEMLSASMPALEVSLDPRVGPGGLAASANGTNFVSDSRIRTSGRRHSDTSAVANAPKSRHFSLSNLLKRWGSRRNNMGSAASVPERAEESIDRSSGHDNRRKSSSSHGDSGGKSRFRLKNLK